MINYSYSPITVISRFINYVFGKNTVLKLEIASWQSKADITDYDDEGGSKYDEVALKILVDEARTLLLRASQSL